MQPFTPLNERILVQVMEEPADPNASNLIIPKGATAVEFLYGKIVAMGEGAVTGNGDRITPAVRVGDMVHFEPRGIRELRELGLVMMTERQIIGIVSREDDFDMPMA